MHLHIRGDSLVPDEVTALLQCAPGRAEQKGKPVPRKDGRPERLARTGCWTRSLIPEETDEWDCGEAILVLLGQLSSSVGIWKTLGDSYRIDISVGLTMTTANKGFSLSPHVMAYLAERGIELGFDVYSEAAPS